MTRRTTTVTLAAAGSIAIASATLALILIQYTGAGTDHLGASIAFGDVNGDGRPDVIAGADVGGYVRVYRPSPSL